MAGTTAGIQFNESNILLFELVVVVQSVVYLLMSHSVFTVCKRRGGLHQVDRLRSQGSVEHDHELPHDVSMDRLCDDSDFVIVKNIYHRVTKYEWEWELRVMTRVRKCHIPVVCERFESLSDFKPAPFIDCCLGSLTGATSSIPQTSLRQLSTLWWMTSSPFRDWRVLPSKCSSTASTLPPM